MMGTIVIDDESSLIARFISDGIEIENCSSFEYSRIVDISMKQATDMI